MTDRGQPPPDDSFDARLRTAQRAHAPPKGTASRGGAMGTAFRMSTDLVSAVVVGGAVGWGLDWWLGTGPWMLLLFFFLGIAAGIMNVVRTAQAMNAVARAEAPALDNRGNGLDY